MGWIRKLRDGDEETILGLIALVGGIMLTFLVTGIAAALVAFAIRLFA